MPLTKPTDPLAQGNVVAWERAGAVEYGLIEGRAQAPTPTVYVRRLDGSRKARERLLPKSPPELTPVATGADLAAWLADRYAQAHTGHQPPTAVPAAPRPPSRPVWTPARATRSPAPCPAPDAGPPAGALAGPPAGALVEHPAGVEPETGAGGLGKPTGLSGRGGWRPA